MNAFTDVIIDAIMKNCLRKKSEQRKICRTKKLIAFENRSDFIFDCIEEDLWDSWYDDDTIDEDTIRDEVIDC